MTKGNEKLKRMLKKILTQEEPDYESLSSKEKYNYLHNSLIQWGKLWSAWFKQFKKGEIGMYFQWRENGRRRRQEFHSLELLERINNSAKPKQFTIKGWWSKFMVENMKCYFDFDYTIVVYSKKWFNFTNWVKKGKERKSRKGVR